MGVGAGLYMCDVVVKSSRSLSHLLMSSCLIWKSLYLQDTCRTAAPDLRDGLEIQRTSVQEQTHLHLPLHFQHGLETIHCLYSHRCVVQHIPLRNNPEWKKYFFTSLLHRYFINFKEWPRVRRDRPTSRWNLSSSGIADKPCAILKTSIIDQHDFGVPLMSKVLTDEVSPHMIRTENQAIIL